MRKKGLAGLGLGELVCRVKALSACSSRSVQRRAVERRRGPLAAGALLSEHAVDIVHFTQALEERDEVEQLGVRHVVEP